MKLEKLNYGKEKIHKIFLYGLIVGVVLLLALTLIPSKAKYRYTQKVPLVKGTVKYSAYDFQIVGIYLSDKNGSITGSDGKKYKEVDVMPGSEYKINETIVIVI